METRIKIAEEFTRTPGGRWKRLGENSGEEFYQVLLLPRFEEAVEKGEELVVYLDGVRSYPNSFLDQSFGELARQKGVDVVRRTIRFETKNFLWIVDYINGEIWDKTSVRKS